MDIEVLGGLAVTENGVPVTPTAPKPRQVLALLALHADQVVPVAMLIEELWGERPPRSARTTLQTYILQLRELIAGALAHDPQGSVPRTAKDVLRTLPGGYFLQTSGVPVMSVSSSGWPGWATGPWTPTTSRARRVGCGRR